MEAIPLPPPYSGQRDDLPLVMIESPYAERVWNWNLDTGAALVRNGDTVHATKTGKTILNTSTYSFGTNQKLFCVYDNGGGTGLRVADASAAGVPTDVYTPGGVGGDDQIQTLFFNNVLTFFGESTWTPGSVGCPQYNGSAWALSGYTYPTIAVPFGGTSYKNRAYVLQSNGTKYAYSAINAISGAMTEVDLAQVMSANGFLYGIRSVSLSEGLEQENVLCFLFNTGEVLVYSGAYPNSSDWKLIGRFTISPPIYYNAFVEARGDSFVITNAGLLSLRTLFTQGADIATKQAISAPIQNRWKQIVGYDWAATGAQIWVKGSYDQIRDRIVITVPFAIATDGTPESYGIRLIFSFKTGSWFEHKITNSGVAMTSTAFFKGDIYQGCIGGIIKAEGATDFVDEQVDGTADEGYPFDLISAPIAMGRSFVARAEGIDVLIESDMYAETQYQFIRDLGVSETVAQTIPNQGTSLQKPSANIGIEGSYIQYRISGTTAASKTVGLKLYGVNVWANNGRSPR